MAPGGTSESICASSAPNGATATHLVTFLMFGLFFAQKHCVVVLNRHTGVLVWQPHASLCGNHTVSLCWAQQNVRFKA